MAGTTVLVDALITLIRDIMLDAGPCMQADNEWINTRLYHLYETGWITMEQVALIQENVLEDEEESEEEEIK